MQTAFDTNLASPTQIEGQTFVPAITGSLGTVQLHTNTFVPGPNIVGPNVTGITVRIFATDGSGLPTGSNLATQDVSPADPGWTTVTFASPANVVAGTKYSLELLQGPADTTRWDFLCADAYGPGQALVYDGTWKTIFQFSAQNCLADFAFTTWIVAANVTAPPTAPATAPPTSTSRGNSGDAPGNPSYLLILAGLAVAASAVVVVSISRRRVIQR